MPPRPQTARLSRSFPYKFTSAFSGFRRTYEKACRLFRIPSSPLFPGLLEVYPSYSVISREHASSIGATSGTFTYEELLCRLRFLENCQTNLACVNRMTRDESPTVGV
ncbi:MAG: hypothetical protein Q9187_000900 [Circinaria calcarea]